MTPLIIYVGKCATSVGEKKGKGKRRGRRRNRTKREVKGKEKKIIGKKERDRSQETER